LFQLNVTLSHLTMNRLFGKGKPKAPPPNLSDCVANVDSRAESVDKKIARLDAELRKYKVISLFVNPNKIGLDCNLSSIIM